MASHDICPTSNAVHPADCLIEAIESLRAPVCVGLDPVLEKLPVAIPREHPSEAIREFSVQVVRAVAGIVPCVKVQAACFERYGPSGITAMHAVLGEASAAGLQVILDAKRGDIGISAVHYASSIFASGDVNWTTINGYLGSDGMVPFIEDGRGAFALVRTSNPGGDAFQGLRLGDGRTVALAMGDLVAEIGSGSVGAHGYSALGAVVGATKPADARELRERMPQQIFLVPGIGAQGGSIDDVLPCFRPDGRGAIVTASRSVIYAFDVDDPGWTGAVADAASALAEDVGTAVGLR